MDIGARGGFEGFLNCFGQDIRKIGFEPDEKECKQLNSNQLQVNERFYPYAIHKDGGIKTFYLTEFGASSGFYKPDPKWVKRISQADQTMTIASEIEMDTVSLDDFCSKNSFPYIDYIKIDTEGCELDILQGAEKMLKNSVLALNLETWIQSIHINQPVFSDIDQYLRSLGFILYEICPYRHARSVLPEISNNPVPGPSRNGQVIWAQSLYMRDIVGDLQEDCEGGRTYTQEQILKMACFMDIFCLNDCAIELMVFAKEKNLIPGINYDGIIDGLAPQISNNTLTYKEYLDMYQRISTMKTQKPLKL
ncbi:MAG: FkbM family methyltransferase [Candidatus Hinthialibacter antarcticus]|nr:FkbM family methyltransferase [Candidatus Hinthialibacter antarcticus]